MISRETLERLISEDESGILDIPSDDDDAGDGWTYGEIRAMADFIVAANARTSSRQWAESFRRSSLKLKDHRRSRA